MNKPQGKPPSLKGLILLPIVLFLMLVMAMVNPYGCRESDDFMTKSKSKEQFDSCYSLALQAVDLVKQTMRERDSLKLEIIKMKYVDPVRRRNVKINKVRYVYIDQR